MRRALLILAALSVIALAGPANAGFLAGPLENDFEGRVERDRTTYFGFDLKSKRGTQSVAKVTARLRYACTDGEAGPATARVKGKLRVESDRFAGRLRRTADFVTRGGAAGKIKYRIRGKFTTKRKAKGTIDAEVRFRSGMKTRGSERVRCYTGEVDWKAKRGADVEPVVPMRGDR